MKINRTKLELAMARACLNAEGLQQAAEIPRPTLNNAITGRGISPRTAGLIAKALGVDVLDLISVSEV